MEANGVLRELGKRAYEKYGENAGAATLFSPLLRPSLVWKPLTVKSRHYRNPRGQFLTPRRLLVGGGAVVRC